MFFTLYSVRSRFLFPFTKLNSEYKFVCLEFLLLLLLALLSAKCSQSGEMSKIFASIPSLFHFAHHLYAMPKKLELSWLVHRLLLCRLTAWKEGRRQEEEVDMTRGRVCQEWRTTVQSRHSPSGLGWIWSTKKLYIRQKIDWINW